MGQRYSPLDTAAVRNSKIDDLLADYDSLSDLERVAVTRKCPTPELIGTATLAEIGQQFGVTREWVRQVEGATQTKLTTNLDKWLPGWQERFAAQTAQLLVIRFADLANSLSPDSAGSAYAETILVAASWERLQVNRAWWGRDTESVQSALASCAVAGCISEEEWLDRIIGSGLPEEFVLSVSFPDTGRIEKLDGYVVRSRWKKQDMICWYLKNNREATTEDLAELIGQAPSHALSELIRRDDRFTRIANRKIWTLTGMIDQPIYKSTLPAILDILQEQGPLTSQELIRSVNDVHAITAWRISQCLDDFRIGRMPDGRIWLVEHGATKSEEAEPSRPESMFSQNHIVGVRKNIDHDVLRGSGFLLDHWLSWRLGLRASPTSITFTPQIKGGQIFIVTRSGGGAICTSIRESVLAREMVEGCVGIIFLDTTAQTWILSHKCGPGSCPVAPLV